MFQVNFPQISLIRQLLIMLLRASPSKFFPDIETSSDRTREFPDTSCSSVADGSSQTGGPFLLRPCVGTLRSASDSRFFLQCFSSKLHQRLIIFVIRIGSAV